MPDLEMAFLDLRKTGPLAGFPKLFLKPTDFEKGFRSNNLYYLFYVLSR
jgi:hypothetical protein